MREIVTNTTKLAKALLDLEKFSLVKWYRPAKTLSIHRLIQAVIKDEMSEKERIKLSNVTVEICCR
jgi:hypothetical protein